VSREWQAASLAALAITLLSCTDHADLPTDRSSTVATSTTASTSILVGAGNIASCSRTGDEATAALVGGTVAAAPSAVVFTTGDNAYENGTAAEYQNCYGPSWGRYKSQTRPVLGNRDYNTTGADPTFDYFGPAAWGESKGRGGFYSFDPNDFWHVIVLNSNADRISTGAGSPQEQWLKADLAANQKGCVLAIWHHPRFYSSSAPAGTTVRGATKPFWVALYNAGADLIVNGDSRSYERLAPQNPDGVKDPAKGIRQIIVGTGGASLSPPVTIHPNSEVRNGTTLGVLKLSLNPGSYDWEFVSQAGKTFTDQGSSPCHRSSPPPPPPPSPVSLTVTGRADATKHYMTLDWSGATGGTVDVYRNGPWLTNTPNDGHYGNSRSFQGPATYVYKVCEVGTAICSNEASVQIGGTPPPNVAPIANFTPLCTGFTCTFTDGSTDPDGTVASRAWRFGDGTSSNEVSPVHIYADEGTYAVALTVTDNGGATNTVEQFVGVTGSGPPPEAAVELAAAGDIAGCGQERDEATAKLLDALPNAAVATLGDNVYGAATLAQYNNCYGPNWGRHISRTRPAPGNHDYDEPGASGYFAYFGAAAGDPAKGYYSYRLGAWHVIALNTEVSMKDGSAQVQWLRADLAAHPAACTLAYWHRPRFSSGPHGNSLLPQVPFKILYDAGADVVLVGHDHTYERFAPQTPDGIADPARGIRQFVVGTGGESHYALVDRKPNSEVFNNMTSGIIKLTLKATGYLWEFVPEAGGSFTDAGSEDCH
jgi:PKD repeat protein